VTKLAPCLHNALAMRSLLLSSLVLFVSACESGTSRAVKVTLPASVATSFTAEAPGLIVADLGSRAEPYVALCGQTPKNPIHLSQDRGFGCLGSLNGMNETVRVWVQPLPAGFSAAAACAQASQQREFYDQLTLVTPDGGIDGGALATAPEASWPQGTDESTWRRDVSPCGGVITFEVTLAVP
jgi:hypothetical protein